MVTRHGPSSFRFQIDDDIAPSQVGRLISFADGSALPPNQLNIRGKSSLKVLEVSVVDWEILLSRDLPST